MLDQNIVLKANELFTAGNVETDGSREMANGLYLRDTRYLSILNLTIDGARPERLAINQSGLREATIIASNSLLTLEEEGAFLPQQLLIVQRLTISERLTVEISLQNFARINVACRVELTFGSDFRDLFDIRGFARSERGMVGEPTFADKSCRLAYRGLDDCEMATTVSFDKSARFVTEMRPVAPPNPPSRHLPLSRREREQLATANVPIVRATLPARIQPGGSWTVHVEVMPEPADGRPVSAATVRWPTARMASDDRELNAIVYQSIADLAGLDTEFVEGPLVAAGIPWFVAPFGRDSLIAAMQTVHLTPGRAIATLRTMATLQATAFDSRSEAEPGKIPHEKRYGEMARTGEVPHTPYYGSVDATPLWLWLFGETLRWTQDRQLYDDLHDHALRAIDWCALHGDLDGDGLIEYRMDHAGPGTISHQVWKDSFDSLHHADGSVPAGPIAAVEVQGYAVAGYTALADVAANFGDTDWATDLHGRAERVRHLIEEHFWLPELGFYAQALDAEKRPVAVPSSNAGHLLACGVPEAERADRLIDRLLLPDMLTHWGLRTLSSSAVTYNPISYHNGSIWPHDNSLIGFGCYRYGRAEAGNRILAALIAAARSITDRRLPELYCGLDAVGLAQSTPVPYPVSCSPQAWAAGAIPFLIRGALGLDIHSGALVASPTFPDGVNEFVCAGMRPGSDLLVLMVKRASDGSLETHLEATPC